MSVNIPRVKFNNGLSCPILGLGTWQSAPGEVTRAVGHAIDVGYRHIDCAHLYLNEKEVGEAIKEKIKQGTVKREDLFITSKLWNTYHRVDLVEKAVKISLSDLGLDYLDLYLIHWPMAYKVECHPYLNQQKLFEFCKEHDITLTAYSPLGSPQRPWAKSEEPYLLGDPKVTSIAKRLNKRAAQILIRYQIERGIIVIPKSTSPQRIEENFNVWDFELTKDDIELIDSLNSNRRLIPQSEGRAHKDHPFSNPAISF